ncbi:MAG: NAD(P)/FAD-dependent oxidoreductase [Alphaproteobacteria bacterium]
MADSMFAAGFKETPYWWEAAPRPSLPEAPPPATVDVAIVGSGFTGLSAALDLARAGRSVLVLDSGDAGFGASSRNGGMVGGQLKWSYGELVARTGADRARALAREALVSLDYTKDLIEREQIACHLQKVGMFVGAHRPSHYEAMARDLDLARKEVGVEAEMVPAQATRTEVDTAAYHGGKVMFRNAGVHPALYHQGLLERARNAGVTVAPLTPVEDIARCPDKAVLTTPRGKVHAREVIVATNGYTRPVTQDLRRRLIPIGSYMIATEPLAPEVMRRLFPNNRMIADTKKILYYYRPSPDRTRVLFGGRAAVWETDTKVSGRTLHRFMTGVFPELAGVKITHSWTGNVAFTFDRLPHIGTRDGIHYAMGYCGSGVAMATHLGHKVAQRILGTADAHTAFADLDFPTRSWYGGEPWFLPLVALWYRFQDRFAA